MHSLRKSLKAQGTYKLSSSWSSSADQEDQRAILLGGSPEDSADHPEVIVKIDGRSREVPMPPENPFLAAGSNVSGVNNSSVWRESSYDFRKEVDLVRGGGERGSEVSGFTFQSQNPAPKKETVEISDDPPLRLISSFLQKQKTAGSEVALDMDLEMEELKKTTPVSPSSKEARVSFHDVSTDPPSRKSIEDSDDDESDVCVLRRTSGNPSPKADGPGATEILQCTSNSSFNNRGSALLRAKTKSRLMDPPPAPATDEKKSIRMPNRSVQIRAKSGQTPQRSAMLKSGMIGKSPRAEEDEDDPFEDLPDEFKRDKISTFTILELIGLVLVIGALICSLVIPRLARHTVWDLHLWKWEVLVLVLISGRLLSGWFVRIIVFFLERNFLLRKRFLYFVYGLRKAVQNCIWLGLVLLAWHFLFDEKLMNESKTLSYITKILFCLIVASALRLVKTLLLKVLASSFHVSTYFDRIQESLFNQYVIETLSGPPLLEIQHNMEEDERTMAEVQKLQRAGATVPNDLRAAAMSSRNAKVIGSTSSSPHAWPGLRRSCQIGRSTKLSSRVSTKNSCREEMQQDGRITIDVLHKLNQKNVSAWNMKRLMKIVRHGSLTTLDEQLTHGSGEDESAMHIRSEHEAKIAARKIFNNVSKPGSKCIYLVDLMRFMTDDEAEKTMSLIAGAQNDSKISKRALKEWVVNTFRERRALSLTLNDTKTAVNRLHQIANVIVAIIVIALWLLILNIATTHFFVFLSSQVLLLVFVFGNTFKTTFEAIIFLFVMHPFDVGDRCEIDGVQMVVEEMNILTTIFLRYDNQKITYPNSVLATLPIGNFYRSPDMGDNIDFCVHVSTSVEKLAIMRERMIAFMENRKDHWYPGSQVVLRDVVDVNRLKISIWMRHRINFQDMGLKFCRRELVVQELIKVLRELDIEYRMLPVDVNVRNLPPVTSSRLPSTWAACT